MNRIYLAVGIWCEGVPCANSGLSPQILAEIPDKKILIFGHIYKIFCCYLIFFRIFFKYAQVRFNTLWRQHV